MTNKESKAAAGAASEERKIITPDTILKRFKLYNDIVSNLRQQNLENGLDAKRNNVFVPQTKLKQQEIYEKFIKQTTNPKTGQWYTIHSLQEAGIISDLDIQQFETTDIPYVRLNRLTRVKSPNGKEWLERMFTIYALTREGNIISKVIQDSDFYHKPIVTHEYVPEDPQNKDGKQIHVSILREGEWPLEPAGSKVQLMEFSADKVHQILRDIPPAGDFSDLYNGCSLTFVKIGETHNATTVKTLAEFLEPFDVVWHKHMDPSSVAQVDVKELVTELQKQTIAAAEEHGQYQ
jgi:hypothetical protein